MAIYLSTNGFFEEDQHGSRSGRSTITQLLTQYDQLLEAVNNGKNCELVFLDFSKAFNLLNHSLALNKNQEAGDKWKIAHVAIRIPM